MSPVLTHEPVNGIPPSMSIKFPFGFSSRLTAAKALAASSLLTGSFFQSRSPSHFPNNVRLLVHPVRKTAERMPMKRHT
ncbi:MAG: hypothetical protein RLZ87_1141 [Armatimonadota bacterium]